MTKQRQLILDLIRKSQKHLNAQEIYSLAKKDLPSIVLATVYNNLNYLSEKNLIKKIQIHDQAAVYDKRLSPHDHLICSNCGQIKDIASISVLDQYLEELNPPITSYELKLYYLCPDCQAKSDPSP